ncbi:excinuclease ABC subunit C [Oenococcus oeni]|uniref:excinuclease ABC subunit UvrC n=2 Tax=Oenococcus oeni TaxID=1247 RepID=UPI0008F9067E|nr:excinuclease ABC subunit UvrC [Oenococcus oeni]OIL89969.1 excinuclease ABC subunit C [Oenococcus oeni]
MASELIEQKLALLPSQPGSYQMKDKNGKIIYVGKAKNLKNRVRSYFKAEHTGKTAELVANIHDFEFIVTNSDKEAFLLENTLIKRYRPYFNIRLKFSGSYPYIEITNERDPRLILANTLKHDHGTYFGPYPNVYAASETLHFLEMTYPLRRCNGYQGRPCLYYSMGQCLGACWRTVPQEEYQKNIDAITRFLNGETGKAISDIKKKMKRASDSTKYELAADFRDRLKFIDQTVESQRVLQNDHTPRDLFNFYMDKGWMTIEIFFLRQGRLLRQQKETLALADSVKEELESYIQQFYSQKNAQKPKEVLVPKNVDTKLLAETLEIPVRTPVRGEKRDLLKLAAKNARITLEDKFRLMELNEEKTTGAMKEITDALKIPHGYRFEAFDHSNTQGSNYVSALVVFEDGLPNKNLYRRYKLRTPTGQDEAKATSEVITRRYTRLRDEGQMYPDLILMDGGEIQLHSAEAALRKLDIDIPVAAMVKNDKHQTADLLNSRGENLFLDPHSQGFYLLQRIQDEVHRFVITFHRQLRTKTNLSSRLDEIAGIGPKSRVKLMRRFGSLPKIADASIEDIEALGIGEKVATLVKVSVSAMVKSENKKIIAKRKFEKE